MLLEKFGYSLGGAFSIGDSYLDIPLLSASRFSASSPLASKEVNKIAACNIASYVS
jgi:phosphoserine phosphatase